MIEWVKENFIRLDEQRFELENQKKLFMCKNFLDEFEKNLKKEIGKEGEKSKCLKT